MTLLQATTVCLASIGCRPLGPQYFPLVTAGVDAGSWRSWNGYAMTQRFVLLFVERAGCMVHDGGRRRAQLGHPLRREMDAALQRPTWEAQASI